MKRVISTVVALGLGLGFGLSQAQAGPACCKSKAKTASASCSAKAAGLGDFPTMLTRVGDETFQCPKAAEKAASEGDAKIVYVVAGEEFGSKDKALAALAVASEEYVRKFTSIACVVDGKVIYCDAKAKGCSKGKGASALAGAESDAKEDKGGCPFSKKGKAALAKAKGGDCCKNARFLVVGRTFDKRADAEKARDAALASIKKVKMTYIVEGKEVDCSSKVCPMAKKAGKVEYVIGDEKTCCETTARVTLARMQYEAAKKAADEKLAKL